ncbi:amidohydrolase family protein [Pseudonocardia acaciae]|uniref:amidohydrolase family protein n=1 Tax=Pseudonocardia acaciae TaxID=551276 RepID=UPI0007E8E817|nr:amidohydrolase family protein [Pseudonocardia acaciae]
MPEPQGRRILLQGGVVVTADASLGVLPRGDVLIDGSTIAAVAPELQPPPGPEPEVIDVAGRLVIPGFVDTHRHTWQSIVRGFAANWTLGQYLAGIHAGVSRHFRPEDTYLANLLGALEALDSGITTLLDWSHNLYTPEHADAAVQALRDSGLRAVFAHGGGAHEWGAVPSDVPHTADVRRVRAEHFASDDGLVTMAIALRGPQFTVPEVNRHDYALATDLDLPITVHVGDGEWGRRGPVRGMARDGLLRDRTTYVHCNTLADDELRMIADSGGSASVAPDVELAMGHGWPATRRLLDAGIRPSLSIDVCSLNGGDMFATMRTTIGVQRAFDNARAAENGNEPERLELTCRDVFEFATIDGARACGLADRAGSLTPGKQADVVVLNSGLATSPLNNPLGALVYAAHPGLVDTVFVAGQCRKRNGALVGVDVPALLSRAERSRDHVIAAFPEATRETEWFPGTVHAQEG